MTVAYYENPEHWVRRSREMRALAQHIKDLGTKTRMLRVAEEYATLARQASAPATRDACRAMPHVLFGKGRAGGH